jgi:hypothetical protein
MFRGRGPAAMGAAARHGAQVGSNSGPLGSETWSSSPCPLWRSPTPVRWLTGSLVLRQRPQAGPHGAGGRVRRLSRGAGRAARARGPRRCGHPAFRERDCALVARLRRRSRADGLPMCGGPGDEGDGGGTRARPGRAPRRRWCADGGAVRRARDDAPHQPLLRRRAARSRVAAAGAVKPPPASRGHAARSHIGRRSVRISPPDSAPNTERSSA